MLIPSPILMICAGNMCRSPFAEHYMRLRLEQAGVYAECFSRGLLAMAGRKVPEDAVKAAEEFGVDLSGHVSQPLLAPDLERAAIVMVMEPEQRQYLAKMRPSQIGKYMMLSQFTGGEAVTDPMGQDEAFCKTVYRDIARHIDGWLARFGVG